MAAKIQLNVRINPAALKWVDSLSKDYDIDRSTVIRSMLRVASRYDEEVRQAIMEAKYA